MQYIKFRIYNGEKDGDGRTVKSVIRQIESSMDSDTTNELSVILHALAGTRGLIEENTGFPYTLPFELS